MGVGSDGGIFVPRPLGAASLPPLISNMSMVSEQESIHLPLPKRYPPVGLKNWGNTCYANAALQCLLSTALARALLEPKCFREFKRFASNVELLHKELQPSKSSSSTEDETRTQISRRRRTQRMSETCHWITKELTFLCQYYTGDPARIKPTNAGFLSYFTNQPAVLDPGAITRHVSRLSSCLRVGRQEDAHEFLRALISNLVMDGQNRKLSALFDGLLESAVTCKTCGHASLTRDRYMDISLEIQGKNITDLVGAFKRFTTTEHLSPDNMVECEKCKVKRRVTKGLRLATAPTILVCHLKRFDYDIFGRMIRLNKRVDFPLRLEIGDFMSRANRSKPPPYELVSVLVHQGRSCDSGHYLSYVKSDGEWYRASDEAVEKVPVSVVLAQRAYILVYEVEGMRNHKIRHSNRDSKSFEGSVPSRSHGSARSHKSSDSALSARSEPTVLSSFFQIMGSCGVLPSEIDCCNVSINKFRFKDDNSTTGSVRRSVSEKDLRTSEHKKRKQKSKEGSSKTASFSDDPGSSQFHLCMPTRHHHNNLSQSKLTDVTSPMNRDQYRTMSDPIRHPADPDHVDTSISPTKKKSYRNPIVSNHNDNHHRKPQQVRSHSVSARASSEVLHNTLETCCSDSVGSDKTQKYQTKPAPVIRRSSDERIHKRYESSLLLKSTTRKRVIRSSSSNNLRERTAEAAYAYRGRSRSNGRSKLLDSRIATRNQKNARSLSQSRSALKLRLSYKSPKKVRADMFDSIVNDNDDIGNSPVDSARPNSSSLRPNGAIKLKRRVSSKVSSASSHLPPLPTPRDLDLLANTIH